MHPILWIVGGGTFLATLLLTQSGCNSTKKREEDQSGGMICEGTSYKPMNCKPVTPDRIFPMKQWNLNAIHQLRENSLKPLNKKIKYYEAKRNMDEVSNLIKHRDSVKAQIAELEAQVGVDPEEFDPENVGPLKDIVPKGDIPVFLFSTMRYGKNVAISSPFGFSHERHLPHLENDLKNGGLGCATCHSDSVGTVHERVGSRIIVNLGKGEDGKEKRGIMIGGSRPLHETICVNCHSAHGRCSTCHDIRQKNQPKMWEWKFWSPDPSAVKKYTIVEEKNKTSLKPH